MKEIDMLSEMVDDPTTDINDVIYQLQKIETTFKNRIRKRDQLRSDLVQAQPSIVESEKLMNFRKELEDLINRYCIENGSDTPDFLLADYLEDCLSVYDYGSRSLDDNGEVE